MIQISIKNGRDRFWQWDVNQQLVLRGGADPLHVHFVQDDSLEPQAVLPVKQADGSFLAPVPNILLQTAEEVIVYVYYTGTDEQYTKTFKRFYVVPREKPAEYIYTETQLVTWEGMIQRVDDTLRDAANILTIADACAQNAQEDAETAQEAANAAAGKVVEAEEQAARAANSAAEAATRADGLQKYAANTVLEMERLLGGVIVNAEEAEIAETNAAAFAQRAEAAAEDRAGVIAIDASGATVTLLDSAERPLRALTVDIVATQSADGAINGWSGAQLFARGKNLLDGSLRAAEWSGYGVTVQYNPEDDTYTLNGKASVSAVLYMLDHVYLTGEGTKATLLCKYVEGAIQIPEGGMASVCTGQSDDGYSHTGCHDCSMRQEDTQNTQNLTSRYGFRTWFYVTEGVTFDNYKVRIQIELGDTATEYEPFRGATASADFGREVYGGRYDWRTGELTITHELADGAVVPLDTPEVVQLEPTAMPSTLYPSTTIFADTGDVTLTYAADTKSYIDRRITELIGAK